MSERFRFGKAQYVGEHVNDYEMHATSLERTIEFLRARDEDDASPIEGYLELVDYYRQTGDPPNPTIQASIDELGEHHLEEMRGVLARYSSTPTVAKLELAAERAIDEAEEMYELASVAYTALYKKRKTSRPHYNRLPERDSEAWQEQEGMWRMIAEEADVYETRATALRLVVDYMLRRGYIRDGELDIYKFKQDLWWIDTVKFVKKHRPKGREPSPEEQRDEELAEEFEKDFGGKAYVDELRTILALNFEGTPTLDDIVELIEDNEFEAESLNRIGPGLFEALKRNDD